MTDQPDDVKSSGVSYLSLPLEWRCTWALEGTSCGGKKTRKEWIEGKYGGTEGVRDCDCGSDPSGKEQGLEIALSWNQFQKNLQ